MKSFADMVNENFSTLAERLYKIYESHAVFENLYSQYECNACWHAQQLEYRESWLQ